MRIAAVGVQRTRHPWLPAVRALPKLEPATTLGTGGRKAEGGLPEKTEQNLQQARGKGHSLYLPLVLFVLLLDPDSVFAPCINFGWKGQRRARVDALMAIAMPHWC